MKAFFSRRTLILIPIACAAIYGCSDTPVEEEALPAELADVIFEGETTDEALVALDSAIDQKAPVSDMTRASVLDMPTGAMLAKTPIPTFTWHAGATVYQSPRDLSFPKLLPVPESVPSFRSALRDFIGPVKSAEAHGTPLAGLATFLVFSTATNAKVLRVFTTSTSYTPSQEAWNKVLAANAEITLSLVSAEFDNNRVADGGGPFQGSKYVFTIAP